ncbi:hypothetical protein EVAR_80562_1 [Eumeta japonica]|uniref:Uncharacterized protein n=1 Tax=Eumeta variegata TaxID=151549 RepID=A0A4C1TNP6_EUMVA|nr:hypothetical protein EVAR_80562_1 [Eumeta japonica]
MGIEIKSLIGIETLKMKELFASGCVQIGTITDNGTSIERGMGNRIENRTRIRTKSETWNEIENTIWSVGSGSESNLTVAGGEIEIKSEVESGLRLEVLRYWG